MNLGAFAAVAHLSGKGDRFVNIDDFRGLARKQPLTAAMFTIFLLSLIGVPLTGGFFGKFYIFKAALESNLVWLTVLGLLNSAVAAYYYLRILVVMYMYEPGEAAEAVEPLSMSMRLALVLPAIGILVLGIFPNWLLHFAVKSAEIMR
jgi:NADH-quinone oxidoreductase subunit N